MKNYWLLFSNGFVMRGTVSIAKTYCKMNNCEFKILCAATMPEF